MQYSFDKDIASIIGVNEAIVLNNLIFWIEKNKAKCKHFYDNKFWTYNSSKAFAEQFPFWSQQQIARILKSLITQEIIVIGNYNKIKFDRTTWYSLSYKFYKIIDNIATNPLIEINNSIYQNQRMDLLKSTNPFIGNDEPIPDINTDSKPDINTYIEKAKNKQKENQVLEQEHNSQIKPGLVEHPSAKASVKVCNKKIKSNETVDKIISYWENETSNQVTAAIKKQVIPLISKVLQDFSIDDCQDVIDYIIHSDYHIAKGYIGLLHIFRPTKFAEKLERAKLRQPILIAKPNVNQSLTRQYDEYNRYRSADGCLVSADDSIVWSQDGANVLTVGGYPYASATAN